jgi:hypothetical protein
MDENMILSQVHSTAALMQDRKMEEQQLNNGKQHDYEQHQ